MAPNQEIHWLPFRKFSIQKRFVPLSELAAHSPDLALVLAEREAAKKAVAASVTGPSPGAMLAAFVQ